MKFILITVLLFGVVYFLFNSIKQRTAVFLSQPHTRYSGFNYLQVNHSNVLKELKSGLYAFATGVLLGVLILLLMRKVVILLLLLPISLYFILQLFVVLNHIRYTENIQFWYNLEVGDIIFKIKKNRAIKFNIYRDVRAVHKRESIQTSKGISPYLYELLLKGRTVTFSYLHDNEGSRILFQTLEDNFDIQENKKFNTFI